MLLALFLFCCLSLQGQVLPISGNFADMKADALGNLYLLESSRQVLHKYSPQGQLLASFSHNLKGPISQWSVDNPAFPLLYFGQYHQVLILDRSLNIQEQLPLSAWGRLSIDAIGLSQDNQLWIVDRSQQRLEKLSRQGKVLFQSPEFYFLFDEEVQIQTIFEADGQVYLPTDGAILPIFDVFANHQRNLALGEVSQVYVQGSWLYYQQGQTFFRHHLLSQQTEKINFPIDNPIPMQILKTPQGWWLRYPEQVKPWNWEKN
jgi:hypothetical protein